jgi:integrase
MWGKRGAIIMASNKKANEKMATKYPGVRYRQHLSRKNGVQYDRCFFIRYRFDGKVREEAVGWALADKMTAEKAAGELAKVKEAIRVGASIVTLADRKAEGERLRAEKALKEKAEALATVTFAEFWDEVYVKYRDKSALETEKYIYRWLRPIIGRKTFNQITELDMHSIRKQVLKAGRAARTVDYCFHVVRVVFGMAVDHGCYEGPHPITRAVKKPLKYDNRKDRYLTQEEASTLLAELKERSAITHDMALLALYCGMRASEVCGVTWGNVDFHLKRIKVGWRTAKGSKTRWVPMPPQVEELLERYEQGKGRQHIFTNNDGGPYKEISKTFARTVQQLGFNNEVAPEERVSFHTLRHTFASWLVQAGRPLHEVQKLLGHSSIRMTERYAHASEEYMDNAIRVFESMKHESGDGEEKKVINLNAG